MSVHESSTWRARRKFYEDLQRWGPTHPPQSVMTADEAAAYCRQLATEHYENFTVASHLLPRSLRQDFCNIYAYCRWADDLGDELESTAAALTGLDWWQGQIDACFQGQATHPVMIALQSTIAAHQLRQEPFNDLLSAFRQDQSQHRYDSDEQLLDYCRRSANPVGRMLLALAKVEHPDCVAWSDAICTGLQIANFCQDMGRDLQLGRVYLPQSRWRVHRLTEAEILRGIATPTLQEALADWCGFARALLLNGLPLSQHGPSWLRRNVLLFIGGGLSILREIERADYDVWSQRVEVRKATKIKLLLFATLGRLPSSLLREPLVTEKHARPLRASYQACQAIARASHSNFYRSFFMLRPDRRQAMFALYAFARSMDDIADEEVERAKLRIDTYRDWVEECYLPASVNAIPLRIEDQEKQQLQPIRLALQDGIQRFHIPRQVFLSLLDGIEYDLQPSVRISNHDAFVQYCHQVATSVGLGCLHIWGADVEASRSPAQACGLAFQTTNILRDVAEDADRGRIYLPLDAFPRYGISIERWLAKEPDGDWKGLLLEYTALTRHWYAEAWKLMEYLPQDGQRMFSLMWRSYARLFERTAAAIASNATGTSIWSGKVRLDRTEKLTLAASHFFSPWYCRLMQPLMATQEKQHGDA